MKRIVCFLLTGIIFLGCFEKEDQNEVKPYEIGEKIVLKGVNGGEKILKRIDNGFVVENEEDKFLLLDFFGTFCIPCQEEAASLTKLQLDNMDNFILIGLTQFEDVNDEYVVEQFVKKYNGFYFISNSKNNDRMLASIVDDIKYDNMIQLPFKVLLKDGEYKTVTDIWNQKNDVKYYLGKISTKIIKKDIEKISNEK